MNRYLFAAAMCAVGMPLTAQTTTTNCTGYGHTINCTSTTHPPADPNPIGTALQGIAKDVRDRREEKRREEEHRAYMDLMNAKIARERVQQSPAVDAATIQLNQSLERAMWIAVNDSRCDDAGYLATAAEKPMLIQQARLMCNRKNIPTYQSVEPEGIRAASVVLVNAANTLLEQGDRAGALAYYRSAANQGCKEAQYSAALLIGAGVGTERDNAEAQRLLSLASAQGYAPATEKLAHR